MSKEHRHCNNVEEYLNTILNDKYFYTIENIANILDMREQYIQINFINKLDTLEIDKTNKDLLREYLFIYYNLDRRIFPKELIALLEQFVKHQNLLKKRILINNNSVIKLIGEIFKKEEYVTDASGTILRDGNGKFLTELVSIKDSDVHLILNSRLYSTTSLKRQFDFKYDTQLYRFLSKTPHIKYVCEDSSNKNNRVRYILH